MLVTALGGTWAIEQPNGSTFEFFPVFQELMLALYKAQGGSAARGPINWRLARNGKQWLYTCEAKYKGDNENVFKYIFHN